MAAIAFGTTVAVGYETDPVRTAVAGEAIAQGKCVAYDLGNANDRKVYLVDLADTDQLDFVGVALDTATAAGQRIRIAIKGATLTGFTLAPATTEAHRYGKPVYTATGGTYADTLAENAMLVGRIVDYMTGEPGVFIDPNYTKGTA